MDQQEHISKPSHVLRNLAIGTALVTGAIILSPYLLSWMGVNSVEGVAASEVVTKSIASLHGAKLGTGLAGAINKGISFIPLVGPAIAKGGVNSAIATAVTGLGGLLVGHFLEKKQDGTQGINWGRVIRYTALATTVLFALPSVLTGISVGVVFLTEMLSNNAAATSVATVMGKTLGSMGIENVQKAGPAGVVGVMATLPHLLTCGASLLPALFSFKLWHKDGTATVHHSAPALTPATAADKPITVRAESSPLTENVPVTVTLKLTHPDTGTPLTEDELATVHAGKLHVMVVDKGLKDYRHIHPIPAAEPGSFTFTFTPKTPHAYTVWTDVTLKDGRHYKLPALLDASAVRQVTPRIITNSEAQSDGMTFTWSATETLRQHALGIVEVDIKDSNGRAVTNLEPVMDAYAHLVGFSTDGKTLIHTHPLSPSQQGSKLRFQLEPESAGPVQFYLQIKREGKDIYVPFGQQVLPPERAVEKLAASPPLSAHSHSF